MVVMYRNSTIPTGAMTPMWTSWGRLLSIETPQHPFRKKPFLSTNGTILATGNLKSYGDSCLLSNGTAFSMLFQDNILAWNPQSGRLKVEAGVLLDHILQNFVPEGWFLPVTPGTKYVSVGGAVANDIHGKNHHRVGTFGHFITSLKLLRSNGEAIVCSPSANSNLFQATIGGLGLTGIIDWVEIQLIPIKSSLMDVEWLRFEGIPEFLELNTASSHYDYTVSWLDCTSSKKGKASAKGIYIRGRHHPDPSCLSIHKKPYLKIPFNFPDLTLNKYTIGMFNKLYYHHFPKHKKGTQHYDPFFYPLDQLIDWNLIYGKRGLYQFQCVIPFKHSLSTFQTMLDIIAASGQASFLSVLKSFGSIPSIGLLSFPEEGLTLCLDFANQGIKTLTLLKQLDELVLAARGRRYPAKDATMTRNQFKQFYPNWNTFLAYKDPKISSDFWERVSPQ